MSTLSFRVSIRSRRTFWELGSHIIMTKLNAFMGPHYILQNGTERFRDPI